MEQKRHHPDQWSSDTVLCTTMSLPSNHRSCGAPLYHPCSRDGEFCAIHSWSRDISWAPHVEAASPLLGFGEATNTRGSRNLLSSAWDVFSNGSIDDTYNGYGLDPENHLLIGFDNLSEFSQPGDYEFWGGEGNNLYLPYNSYCCWCLTSV